MMDVHFILNTVYLLFYFSQLTLSCLCVVYGDNRVIHYTGADVDTGGAEDIQMAEWGLAWD